MKSRIIACAALSLVYACSIDAYEPPVASGGGHSVAQRLEDWGDLDPQVLSGPVLVEWRVTSGSTLRSDYGIRLQTRASGTVSVRFDGCSLDNVKRAFDLMRSKPQRDDAAWTWSVPCPGDAIAASAKLFVEPNHEGYSYLELAQGTGSDDSPIEAGNRAGDAGAAAKSVYLVIANRCANLVKHFGITERAAALSAGATEPDFEFLRSNRLVPLVCGQERVPAQTVSTLGIAQLGLLFTKRRAVYLRRTTEDLGDVDVLFQAIDGESVDALWKDRAKLLSKLKEIAAPLGAAVATQTTNGAEELSVESRGFPVGAEAWDLQTATATASRAPGAKPVHRRWGPGGKLLCLSGADPSRDENASCDGDSLELAPSWGNGGTRAIRLVARGSEGSRSAVRLPDCVAEGESPNWKMLLGLGAVGEDARSWLERREATYREPVESLTETALPCLVPRACRISIASGSDLSRQFLVRPSLNSKSLLAPCPSQCKGPCAEAVVTLAGDVTVGGSGPLTIDRDSLPDGMSAVRILGGATRPSIKVAEAAANRTDGTYVGTKPVPAISVTGAVDVTLAHVGFAAAPAGGKLRTPAPALARVALEITGTPAARPTVRLEDVEIAGGIEGDQRNWPLYEGLRAKAATLYVHRGRVRAYKRAVGVEDVQLSVVGDFEQPVEMRSGVLAEVAASLYSLALDGNGKPISLASTAKNFPALDLGAGTTAFVAQSAMVGPLALAWAGAYGSSDARTENAVFCDVSLGGGGATDPEALQARALGLWIHGDGVLRFEKPSVANTHMPMECAVSTDGGTPIVQMVQQQYSCTGTAQSYMIGASLCAIEQSADWERDENWPGCLYP